MSNSTAITTNSPQTETDQIKSWARDHNLRTFNRLPVVFVRGEGVRLWDNDGKRYIDWVSGGRAGLAFGHGDRTIGTAIKEQVDRLVYVSNDFYSYPQSRLAMELAKIGPCSRTFFCNSGAEANEAAIKLMRKWAKQKKGENAVEIVTALKSFHGRTLGALTATGQEKFQRGFEPLPAGFKYVPFNDVAALQAAIGPRTAGVLFEPVQGETGIYPATKEFFQAARALCDRHDALFAVDEIQSGYGRTGRFWAHQHFSIVPDIITCAKTMGGGLPLGACMASEDASTGFSPGDHGSTFGGNPLACAGGLAALEVLQKKNLVAQADARGKYFRSKLEALAERAGVITEIRTLGLMIGVDVRQPVAFDTVKACLADGLIINASNEHTLRFLPAYVIHESEIDEGMTVLEKHLIKAR